MINKEFILSSVENIPDYVNSEALDYWFTNQKFTALIKELYNDKDFFVGDFFDFSRLNTRHLNDSWGNYNFTRDISEDFENVLQIKRKTYSAFAYEEGGSVLIITYELYFPNY